MKKNYFIVKEYGIKTKCVNTENLQENSILELIHKVIANLVHTFYLKIII